jgi:hypothetical protein
MNTDVEDLLREGMERFTADLRAPAGLTQRAARRRRRRLALRSAAGAAAALAAGAVALVAVVVPGGRDDGTRPAVDAAYVVKRVDSALSAAGPGAIAQVAITTRSAATPGGTTVTTTAEEWSYGDQWRSVTYSRAGHPVYDEGFSPSSVYTLVSYLTRTWARQPGLGRPAVVAGPAALGYAAAPKGSPVPVPSGCGPPIAALPLLLQPGLPGIGFSASSPPATVAKALRTEISCGTLTVAGRQRVNGIEAIELTSRAGSPVPETIWVSPGTYLPVRIVIRSGPGAPVLLRTADITWLRPTAQNLAMLTVPIPAGFRQVPLAKAVALILYQVPGGLKPQALCPMLTGPRAGTKPLVPAPFKGMPVVPRPSLSPPANIRITLGPGDVC